MSVIRAVDDQDTGLSAQPAEKEKKVEDKKRSVKVKSSSSSSQPAAVSTDQRFEELDKKWSDRFNRLEALLLDKSLDQPQPEQTFGTVMRPIQWHLKNNSRVPESLEKVTLAGLSVTVPDRPVKFTGQSVTFTEKNVTDRS